MWYPFSDILSWSLSTATSTASITPRRRPSFFHPLSIQQANSSNSSSVGVPSFTKKRYNALQIPCFCCRFCLQYVRKRAFLKNIQSQPPKSVMFADNFEYKPVYILPNNKTNISLECQSQLPRQYCTLRFHERLKFRLPFVNICIGFEDV